MGNKFSLTIPKHFDFKQTVRSHGWSALLPFEWNEVKFTLDRVLTIDDSAVSVSISHDKENVLVRTGETVGKAAVKKIARDIGHVLRFDDDLTEFYKLLKSDKELAWIAKHKAGRIMRSPTVFEDLVKTICTTNCSWAMTKIMTRNLVEKLGAKTVDGKSGFPTPEAMARKKAEFYTEEIKAGYRAGYFKELVDKIVKGQLDPESWLTTAMPTDELKKEMKKVKGVGDYAADNLLKLVGRYDGLALDSFLRSQFYKTYRAGEKCIDSEIHAHYEKFGPWRGLVIWCDMTKENVLETGI